MGTIKGVVSRGLAIALALIAAGVAEAQDYPNKPISLTVAGFAGGRADAIARLFAPALSGELGQQVVVINGPVAATTNWGERTNPDGYNLLVTNQPLTPSQVAPVAMLALAPLVLVVNPAVAGDVRAFTDKLRQQPDAMKYGAAAGSLGSLAAERFKQALGVRSDTGFVPFQGTAPAVVDLMAGRISYSFQPQDVALRVVESGQLRALAVAGRKRSAALPDVPTLEEAGISNVTIEDFVGLFAPARVPAAVLERLRRAAAAAIALPEIRTVTARMGFEPPLAPNDFANFLRNEILAHQPPVCCSTRTCGDDTVCQRTPQ